MKKKKIKASSPFTVDVATVGTWRKRPGRPEDELSEDLPDLFCSISLALNCSIIGFLMGKKNLFIHSFKKLWTWATLSYCQTLTFSPASRFPCPGIPLQTDYYRFSAALSVQHKPRRVVKYHSDDLLPSLQSSHIINIINNKYATTY